MPGPIIPTGRLPIIMAHIEPRPIMRLGMPGPSCILPIASGPPGGVMAGAGGVA
jgi:hypothetical protein